jgi:hypothetical protein
MPFPGPSVRKFPFAVTGSSNPEFVNRFCAYDDAESAESMMNEAYLSIDSSVKLM